jgi:hypothetical protein
MGRETGEGGRAGQEHLDLGAGAHKTSTPAAASCHDIAARRG